MPALLLSASPDCWTLKGEGKAGAVFTYTGKEKCLVSLLRISWILALLTHDSLQCSAQARYLICRYPQVGLVLRAKKLESRLQERFPELELEIWQAVPGLVSRGKLYSTINLIYTPCG